MKNEQQDIDQLIRRALRSTEEPEEVLVTKVKYQLSRRQITMKSRRNTKRVFETIAAAAVIFILTGTTVFAAWHFLKPGEIADQLGNSTLSNAFEKEMPEQESVHPSISSGGYTFTLLGILSGEDITDLPYYSENVQKQRTYAVLAIQNSDGTPMPDTTDAAYGKLSFFVSPLVKGLTPWQVNILTMNGAYAETVMDGILYRMVECDDISVFADRGLYLAISTGTFYDTNAFVYNEQTGEVDANKSFDGASAVFNLEMDPSLADPEKAADYLAQISDSSETNSSEEETNWETIANWEEATTVEGTKKELSIATDGTITYTYETEDYGSGTITYLSTDCFTDDPAAQSKIVNYMMADETAYAVRLSKDENGMITGEIVIPK
ncbi:MAG: DUF4179 domain-containing protein [Lachnospiraceae bacterium]